MALTAERARRDGARRDLPHARRRARRACEGARLAVDGFAGLPDGPLDPRRADEEAGHPAALGREVAERMLAAGAAELLAEAERL